MSGPCTWPVSYVNCTDGSDPDAPPSVITKLGDRRQWVEDMATEFLWRWTGGQFGVCPVTVRPCRRTDTAGDSTFTGGRPGAYLPTHGASPFAPALIAGRWLNIGCGSCGDSCSCTGTDALRLPGPIVDVTEVRIDGTALDPAAYRVDNRRLLVRTDGGRWPTWQDIDSPPTDPGTFLVSYDRGTPVPPGGQAAAGLLAAEFAKALCRDKSCQLPQRVQSISRQGVTVAAVLDQFDDIDTGHTGIWMVDSWMASVTRASVRSRVYSPDLPRPRNRRQTWPV